MNIDLLAYIDPMSGAIILQLIMACVAGVATFFRKTIFGGLKKLFGGFRKEAAN